jgi:2-polyprenyl-3-methyl-5-hydroxy-6-metoxy-1,4-benzoquinol methylase
VTGDTLETLARLDPRIPSWAHDQAADRACPLCDRPRPPVLRRPDGLPLAHCQACHLWFVATVISEDELRRFYSDYWGTFRPAPGTPSSVRRFRGSAEAGAVRDIRLQRLEALLGGLGGRRILEVGCGLGAFLVAARARGAEVIGQEVSGAACAFVREKIGVPVLHEPLESVEKAVGAVDAVAMIDVLEHLARPKEALASVWRILPPDGLLLLWTPNGGGAGSSLRTARSWVGFRVDLDHLQYFSAATIAGLCDRGRWRIEHLETVGFPDFDGIGAESTAVGRRARIATENFGSRIPGARPLVRAVKAFGRELRTLGGRDPRLGTYHLFTILRKAREDMRPDGAGE